MTRETVAEALYENDRKLAKDLNLHHRHNFWPILEPWAATPIENKNYWRKQADAAISAIKLLDS